LPKRQYAGHAQSQRNRSLTASYTGSVRRGSSGPGRRRPADGAHPLRREASMTRLPAAVFALSIALSGVPFAHG
jgi:hypothetical protein